MESQCTGKASNLWMISLSELSCWLLLSFVGGSFKSISGFLTATTYSERIQKSWGFQCVLNQLMEFTEIAHFGSWQTQFTYTCSQYGWVSVSNLGNKQLHFAGVRFLTYEIDLDIDGAEWLWKHISNLYLEIWSETTRFIVPVQSLSPEHINECKKKKKKITRECLFFAN